MTAPTPGPNDYHVGTNGIEHELRPGLGADEPSDATREAMKSASGQRLLALKEEVALQTAELSDKERRLEEQALRLAHREAALAAREKLAASEPPAPKGKARAPATE